MPDLSIIQGQEALAKKLDELFIETENSQEASANPHYIHYQVGEAQALIKIDTAKKPFYFWFNDFSFGRPASALGLTSVFQTFLQEKFQVDKENFRLYFDDLHRKDEFLTSNPFLSKRVELDKTLDEAKIKMDLLVRPELAIEDNKTFTAEPQSKATNWLSSLGFFKNNLPTSKKQLPSSPSPKKK